MIGLDCSGEVGCDDASCGIMVDCVVLVSDSAKMDDDDDEVELKGV